MTKKIRAKMVDNLVDKAFEYFTDLDSQSVKFFASISGKEVDLIFTGNDAFEINDNNHWLPDHLWTEIKGDSNES